jgi:hypothetical protein
MPLPKRDMTDWERVKREYDSDAPVPYDANDPDDGPYDPNDDAAVDAFFDKATIWAGWPNQVLIQKDGVPVSQDETATAEEDKPRSKAS